ncbi:hypothetical protein [Desulfitobacterium sp.]|uniref:hypothetical protein n=1 Tax=Desulfitobacterium sp. TaxID=49981 RepID=UPI002B218555|nr:hypothetical protein [Desulfitobacterium sp.]MEA4900232.1 sigma factor G inhibitor Gin [Desulfitobacterium sp.]
MKLNILPRCQCCQEVPVQGLYDGIRIQGGFFCSSCCQNIITSSSSSVLYQHFLEGVKKALFQ